MHLEVPVTVTDGGRVPQVMRKLWVCRHYPLVGQLVWCIGRPLQSNVRTHPESLAQVM